MKDDVIPLVDPMRSRLPAGFDSTLVLPLLRAAQDKRGYVADEDIDAIALDAKVPRIQVEEVLSFYTMFRRTPIGRHHVQVCRNVSCSLRGAETLLDHVCKRVGAAVGETTPDGRVTVGTTECLGSCGTAPVVMVNDTYHENMTAESLDELLDKLA